MLFDQNIKQPSHEKIVLSGSIAVTEEWGRPVILLTPKDAYAAGVVLDENDAIRLGAFLVRWYRERNRAELAAEAARIKASREAKKARYAERNRNKTP